MSGAILSAKDISYCAGGRLLVSHATFGLYPGEITVLVGPNGAGKSTILRLLSGELRPTAGTIFLDDRCLSQWPAWRLAAKRAVLPQASTLAFPFTVREVVQLGVDGIGRGLDGLAKRRIVEQAMADSDIMHLAGRAIDTLSGGERQRTHIARILAQCAAGRTLEKRQLLLLDEPTSGLDIRHQISLMAIARRQAQEGHTVLAILHELHVALRYADRLLVAVDGKVKELAVASGATGELAEAFGVGEDDLPVISA